MNEIFWQGTDLKTKVLLAYLRSPDHPMKIRLIRGLLDKLFPGGVVVKNKLGAQIRVQPNDYIGWAILHTGNYEGVTLTLAAELLKSGGVFFDIGANFGLFTCSLGVLENVECYSIEPFAKNFLNLKENISMNHTIKTNLFNLALDKSENLLELEDFNSKNSGTVRVLLEDRHPSSSCHTVAATTLRNLILHTNVKTITLMKIDVEGYELPILEGMDWQSSLRPHNVIVEFTDYSSRSMGSGRKSVLEFFTKRGYEGFTVDGKPLSLEQNTLEDNAWFRDVTHCQQNRPHEDASFYSYPLL